MKSLLGKLLFILGNDIVFKTAVMQIKRNVSELESGKRILLQRILKETHIVRLLVYIAIDGQYFFIYFKKTNVSQTTVLIRLFRKRTREIQIDS